MKTKLATIAVTTKQLDNSRSAQLYSLNNKNDGDENKGCKHEIMGNWNGMENKKIKGLLIKNKQ